MTFQLPELILVPEPQKTLIKHWGFQVNEQWDMYICVCTYIYIYIYKMDTHILHTYVTCAYIYIYVYTHTYVTASVFIEPGNSWKFYAILNVHWNEHLLCQVQRPQLGYPFHLVANLNWEPSIPWGCHIRFIKRCVFQSLKTGNWTWTCFRIQINSVQPSKISPLTTAWEFNGMEWNRDGEPFKELGTNESEERNSKDYIPHQIANSVESVKHRWGFEIPKKGEMGGSKKRLHCLHNYAKIHHVSWEKSRTFYGPVFYSYVWQFPEGKSHKTTIKKTP